MSNKEGSKIAYTTSLNSELVKQFKVHCVVNQTYQNAVLEQLIENLLNPSTDSSSQQDTTKKNESNDNHLTIDIDTLPEHLQSILRGVADRRAFVIKVLEHYVDNQVTQSKINSQQTTGEEIIGKEIPKQEEVAKEQIIKEKEITKKETTVTLDKDKKEQEEDKTSDFYADLFN